MSQTLELVLGPPGCGKTTTLISIVKQELADGVKPNRIGFVAFTKKAATESKDRTVLAYNGRYDEKDFPWFRTLHSLAFRCLRVNRKDVFGVADRIKLGKALGVFIGGGQYEDDDMAQGRRGYEPGTMMLNIDNLSRTMMISLQDAWKMCKDERIRYNAQVEFSAELKRYKDANGVYDFADMLSYFVLGKALDGNPIDVPALDVLIVDEAQDLTRLQWEMVWILGKKAKRIYVAGDDDQAIYAWAGADLKTFMSLKSTCAVVLDHSYRLPRQVHRAALAILTNIGERYTKKFSPRDAEGSLDFVDHIEEANLEEGRWFVLVRNVCFMWDIVDYLRTQGYSYHAPISAPLDNDELTAICAYEHIRKNPLDNYISVEDARVVYSYMLTNEHVKKGFKTLKDITGKVSWSMLKSKGGLLVTSDKTWMEALPGIPDQDREYYRALIRNKDLSKPRILVRTIHAVKGGEVDNVLLVTDMTQRTFDKYERDPDAEHRVWYVGATRARQRLVVKPSQELFSYRFPIGPYE